MMDMEETERRIRVLEEAVRVQSSQLGEISRFVAELKDLLEATKSGFNVLGKIGVTVRWTAWFAAPILGLYVSIRNWK